MSPALLVSLLVLIACFCVVMAVMNMLLTRKRNEQKRIRRRMNALREETIPHEQLSIERQRQLSSLPWLHRVLSRQRWSAYWETVLEQANVRTPLSVLLLSGLLGAGTTLWLSSLFTDDPLLMWLTAITAGCTPFMWLYHKRSVRMNTFKRQLPDALDLIARSLKAGHAFSQGMRAVANEFPDPIGGEFAKTLDEINFGIPQDIALFNLVKRVDCTDLKFFAVSVSIQKETGGNLAELIGNISSLIRDRFKFEGHVRVLATEGKLAAYVLVALPFAIGFILNLLNADYMRPLFASPEGHKLLYFNAGLLATGILMIKKIITIRV